MRLICPVISCRVENDAQAEQCARCGASLHGYARLSAHPARLFNEGLAAARNKEYARARDLFAAVIYWCPIDLEARNAFAMTCYALDDRSEALAQWKAVLARAPTDAIATSGVAAIASRVAAEEAASEPKPIKPSSKKKRGGPKRRR
jgi:hypothetical protein